MIKAYAFHFFLASAFAALILSYPAKIFADSLPNCDFQPQLDELKNIQENPLPDYQDNMNAELMARKNLLKNVLACSIEQARQNQAALSKISSVDDNVKNISQNISSKLDDVIHYYQSQETRIDNLGIQGSKDFAKEISDWREANYWPLDQEVNNFIIWANNQNLIKTAGTRLGEVKAAVSGLNLDENTNVSSDLNAAEVDFNQAQGQNDLAEKAFQNFALPDNSLTYIKASLDYLAGTYQDFFKISQDALK